MAIIAVVVGEYLVRTAHKSRRNRNARRAVSEIADAELRIEPVCRSRG